MQKVTMIAGSSIKDHTYAGRRLKPGKPFECDEEHVSVMERLGHRRKDSAEGYQTRAMNSSSSAAAAPVSATATEAAPKSTTKRGARAASVKQ